MTEELGGIYYYQDHLEIAKTHGYNSVSSLIRHFSTEFEFSTPILAELFKVTRCTIITWKKKIGLPIRPKGGKVRAYVSMPQFIDGVEVICSKCNTNDWYTHKFRGELRKVCATCMRKRQKSINKLIRQAEKLNW